MKWLEVDFFISQQPPANPTKPRSPILATLQVMQVAMTCHDSFCRKASLLKHAINVGGPNIVLLSSMVDGMDGSMLGWTWWFLMLQKLLAVFSPQTKTARWKINNHLDVDLFPCCCSQQKHQPVYFWPTKRDAPNSNFHDTPRFLSSWPISTTPHILHCHLERLEFGSGVSCFSTHWWLNV